MIRSNLYVKRRLVSLEVDIFSFTVKSVKEKKSRARDVEKLKKLIRNKCRAMKLSQDVAEYAASEFVNVYNYVRNQSYQSAESKRLGRELSDDRIYQAFRRKITDNSLNHIANELTYREEFETKHELIYGIRGLLSRARGKGRSASPFFISSSHANAAKEHIPYENKVYYDELWEKNQKYTPEERIAIRAKIDELGMMSIQTVMGKPIFFATRRNCRHFFKNLELGTVLDPNFDPKEHLFKNTVTGTATDAELCERRLRDTLRILEGLEARLPHSILLKQDLKLVKDKITKIKNKI